MENSCNNVQPSWGCLRIFLQAARRSIPDSTSLLGIHSFIHSFTDQWSFQLRSPCSALLCNVKRYYGTCLMWAGSRDQGGQPSQHVPHLWSKLLLNCWYIYLGGFESLDLLCSRDSTVTSIPWSIRARGDIKRIVPIWGKNVQLQARRVAEIEAVVFSSPSELKVQDHYHWLLMSRWRWGV